MAETTPTTGGGERQEREQLADAIIDCLHRTEAVLMAEPIDDRIVVALRIVRQSADDVASDLPGLDYSRVPVWTDLVIECLNNAKSVLMLEPTNNQLVFATRLLDIVTNKLLELGALAALHCSFDESERLREQAALASAGSPAPMPEEPLTIAQWVRWAFDTAVGLAIYGVVAWLLYSLALSQGWLS